jgi:hypothetical protein
MFNALNAADAQLLRGIGSLNFAMAEVEAIGFQQPDPEKLKAVAPEFGKARDLLRASIDAVVKIKRGAPSRLGVELDYTMKEVESLHQSIDTMISDLSAGKFPNVASCDSSAAALRELYTTMRRNARIVRS